MYASYFEQAPAYEFLHDLSVDPTEFTNLAKDPAYLPVLQAQRARCEALRKVLS